MNNQMTKLRKPNTIEFALQNALKNLTEEELKSATNKSKSHFFKCGDPDDQNHSCYQSMMHLVLTNYY